MQKEDAKKRHKSYKVSLKKSAATGKKKNGTRSPMKCGSCGQAGHNCKPCPLPPVQKDKSGSDLLDWNLETPQLKGKLSKEFEPDLIKWS